VELPCGWPWFDALLLRTTRVDVPNYAGSSRRSRRRTGISP
jgi:hypothetical protein